MPPRHPAPLAPARGPRRRRRTTARLAQPAAARPVRQPGGDRRAAILELLRAVPGPHPGDLLAERFGVSRQAVVHDIAVLRAEGAPIVATVRGYLVDRPAGRLPHHAVVKVRHRPEETEDELLAIVDLGVRVADVVVDHPVYGSLRGELGLASPAEVRQWAESSRRSGVRFLSELTGGVHWHTLEADSEAALEAARRELSRRGYLAEEEGGQR